MLNGGDVAMIMMVRRARIWETKLPDLQSKVSQSECVTILLNEAEPAC